ncbi:MAG: tyrosine-type recombinase/integrase [Desulfomonilaceae bacterium]
MLNSWKEKTDNLITTFLHDRNPSVFAAYRTDMDDFAKFLSVPDNNQAAQLFLCFSPGNANRLVLEYRQHLSSQGLSPASVNRKLSTLRSLTKRARLLGLITWSLEVENLKVVPVSRWDLPESGFKRILRNAKERTDRKGIRDQAILLLLHDVALRRAQIISLDHQDVDTRARTVTVTEWGGTQKIKLRLSRRTFAVLAAWIGIRGNEPGPLFVNFSRNPQHAGRLTKDGLYAIVKRMGIDTDQRLTPHGLRETRQHWTAVQLARA